MRRIGRFIVACFAILGVVVVAIVGLGMWAALRLQDGENLRPLPNHMILTLDMDRGFRETADADPFGVLTSGGAKPYVLPRVISALDHAASDPKVSGVFATIDQTALGFAVSQEVRAAIERFKASGKPAVVFSESMGESGNGTLAYYLASAFSQIWLQPSGEIALQGFGAEMPYLKGLLDILGVEPQFSGRWEYKSAIEMFTEKGMSAPHRENLGALLDSFSAQVVAGIAQSRKLVPDIVGGLVGKGPFLAQEALSSGLVDQVGYRDQAEDSLDDMIPNDDTDNVDVADYGDSLIEKGTGIAVITGVGEIHGGRAQDPFGRGPGFAADDIAQAIRDAVDDDRVKGILFRVDSPGGSYTASDTIWREVVRARTSGKPVVVSMGDVAASGGYFVGMGADRVVAEPGTITGSIGVFTGKLVMKDLWSKVGVNWDGLLKGENAGMWSANRPFTPAQWDRVNQMLDVIYKDFTTKAADGRHIDMSAMDQLARGRVWSGADAKRLGLVDALGGIDVAKAELRTLLKLEPQAPLRSILFPEPKKPWELVSEMLQDGVSDRVALGHLAAVMQMAEPLLRQMQMFSGVQQDHAQLKMEPLRMDAAQ